MNVAQRYDLMNVVLVYINDVLVPYYQESPTPACKKVTRAENLTLVGLSFGSHFQSVQNKPKKLQNVQALSGNDITDL